jgi:Na+-transporting NADH:ubiquinone oxidoreductase subunit C
MKQQENKLNDRRLKVLQVADIYDPELSISEQFLQLESKFIDFDTGRILTEYNNFNIDEYDQVKATKDSNLSTIELTSENDIALLKRRENFQTVYLHYGVDSLNAVILPVRGYGLWGTMKGYLALEPDLKTVIGLEFFDHKETPGLGGEIDNP